MKKIFERVVFRGNYFKFSLADLDNNGAVVKEFERVSLIDPKISIVMIWRLCCG
jgi:hypothetical protein